MEYFRRSIEKREAPKAGPMIGITLKTYTHVSAEDTKNELNRDVKAM